MSTIRHSSWKPVQIEARFQRTYRLGNGLWKSTGHVTQKGETRDPNTPVRLESNILKTAGDVI